MILDTSALLSILLQEPDAATYAESIKGASGLSMSAATLTEAMMVIAVRKGGFGVTALQKLLREAKVRIVPVDECLATEAFDAWLRFGKGNHPAKLNFGDCFAYALATQCGEPLLFKGDDFSQTDVKSALLMNG